VWSIHNSEQVANPLPDPAPSFPSGVTVMSGRIITDARAEALFVADLQRSDHPTPEEVKRAIRLALIRHGGSRNCAALVAAEFGDHPETAVVRMRWVLQVLRTAYPDPMLPSQRRPRVTVA
jgi:hypothetical protein